jgi:hypothetical protein
MNENPEELTPISESLVEIDRDNKDSRVFVSEHNMLIIRYSQLNEKIDCIVLQMEHLEEEILMSWKDEAGWSVCRYFFDFDVRNYFEEISILIDNEVRNFVVKKLDMFPYQVNRIGILNHGTLVINLEIDCNFQFNMWSFRNEIFGNSLIPLIQTNHPNIEITNLYFPSCTSDNEKKVISITQKWARDHIEARLNKKYIKNKNNVYQGYAVANYRICEMNDCYIEFLYGFLLLFSEIPHTLYLKVMDMPRW